MLLLLLNPLNKVFLSKRKKKVNSKTGFINEATNQCFAIQINSLEGNPGISSSTSPVEGSSDSTGYNSELRHIRNSQLAGCIVVASEEIVSSHSYLQKTIIGLNEI